MTDRLDDLLAGMPMVDPGPAFTEAVMAALPVASRPALHHGRWMAGILAAVVLLLLWDPGSDTVPTLASLQTSLATWSGFTQVFQADLWQQVGAMPWPVLTRSLYAIAAGLVLAWSVPELAFARRRVSRR